MDNEKVISKLKNKKMIILIIIIITVIFSGIYIFNKSNKTEEIILYGNVDIRQVSLAFNASDRIDKMLVEEGDKVQKGQLLATLDTENLLLQIEKSKAQIETQKAVVRRLKNGSRPEEIAQKASRVNAAKAEAENAKILLQRVQNTYKNSDGLSVSKQEIDDAKSRVRVTSAQVKEASETYRLAVIGPRQEDIAEAEAQLKAAEAELAIQEYLLSQSELKSPVNAIVRSRLQEPGDMASPQRPTYLLALDEKKWVRAYIQETQLGHVKQGMNVEVYIDSYMDKPIKGQVGYISSVAEFTPKTVQTEELRTSLLYEIRVYVDDNEDILRMGMPATVKIKQPGSNSKHTANIRTKE
jgi:HlyD family secretion protein